MAEYYKLREDLSIEFFGHKLFRIECIKELKDVKVGDLGGYIEKEENLTGNAWVYGDAKVSGNARVYGNAEVFGNAEVYGDARVYGDAEVFGDAKVFGNAMVSGDARVYGDKIRRKNDVCNITGQDYNITITPNHIKIGCQYHSKTAWFKFRDSEIEKMDGQLALEVLAWLKTKIYK